MDFLTIFTGIDDDHEDPHFAPYVDLTDGGLSAEVCWGCLVFSWARIRHSHTSVNHLARKVLKLLCTALKEISSASSDDLVCQTLYLVASCLQSWERCPAEAR